MTDIAKIRFYDIEKCGYYHWGNRSPKYGSILQLLEDLEEWSDGLTLEETRLSNPKITHSTLPTYLLNICHLNDSYLVTLWNSVAGEGAKVTSISSNSTLENPEFHENEIPKGSIPGYPTYFWALPSLNNFASIRLNEEIRTGQPEFAKYMEDALAFICRYVLKETNATNMHEILGYGVDKEEALFPYFRTSLSRNKSKVDFFLENAEKFTLAHRKEEIDISKPDNLGFWKAFARKSFGLEHGQDKKTTVQLYSRSPIIDLTGGSQLNKENIKSMIDTWEESDAKRRWNNLGLQMPRDPDIHWLSSHIQKTDFPAENLKWLTADIADPKSLLMELSTHKDEILENSKAFSAEE